ncbi:universal stress protein [Aestuariivivens sediminicola]|uniref:universal stress protein n=1 Tax=Aestuariivivens sediminicola TaxID=2913560 RepID=UPI001F578DA9|nr:universal stress protein [Aestuariivivens sediminicola]
MKNILLPTDFSENSWNAIAYAIRLFEHADCKFHLLHTYTPEIYHLEYVLGEPSQFGMQNYARDNAITNLDTLKHRILKELPSSRHSFEEVASFNTLVTEIKDLVEARQIDYVIMGTKGASGVKELLFGSNTVHTMKHMNCPILAIPDNYSFEKPEAVLFPTDYKINFKAKHLKPLIDIVALYNSKINILHATYGYDLSESQKKNKRRLNKHLKDIAHLHYHVSNQTVEEGISKFQLKTHINLLVMMKNRHSFFEKLFFKSTINHIGFHLNVPFLVIPEAM